MRRLLHAVSRVVVAAGILFAGVCCIAAAVLFHGWNTALVWLETQRLPCLWLGVGLVSLAVLFMCSGLPLRRRDRYLSFDNESGTVSISAEAISDYIEKLIEEFPSVVRLRAVVVPRRGAVDLLVNVRVRAGSQVHEMCELLQQRVRESMVNGLGISQVRRVEVSVREIVSEHKPK